MSKLFCFLSLIVFLNSCSSHHEEKEVEPIQITKFAKEVFVPKALFKRIEDDLTFETKVLNPVYLFAPLKVQFTEKSKQTLNTHTLVYSFPKGGGELDLSEIVQGQGSFYLSFPSEQFHDLPELEHLFFISKSPVTEIGKESYGIGCGKWIDLKKNFINLQKPKFLSFNTTLNAHLPVLAGHYVFVFRKSNQIYLTQLTLTDSKNKNSLCPEITGDSL